MSSADRLCFWLVLCAAGLSFLQLPAMLVAPRVLDWRRDLSRLQAINQRIVLVIGIAIMIVVQGTGVVCLVGAPEMAAGTRLGTALAGFMTLFWGYRTSVQVFAYAPVWPRTPVGRASHWGLLCLFATQTGLFLLVFGHGIFR